MMKKILVVGAGFAGATIARTLADNGNFSVDVIDKREHVAGNAYDPIDKKTNQRFHQYGPHIFHTNSEKIVSYLSRFTRWYEYRHKVRAILPDLTSAPFPVNRETINALYHVSLSTKSELKEFLKTKRKVISHPRNAEDYLQSIYGEEITELFFARYTKKMWGMSLNETPVSVVKRIPVRLDDRDDYFNDEFQLMPREGYENLVANMLDDPRIKVRTGYAFDKSMENSYAHVFNSMPIDEYFDFCFGYLPYRSIRFEHHYDESFPYEVPTVNFTDNGPYTRKTDWSLYPGCFGKRGAKVTYEIPCSYEENDFERYYPVKTVDGWPQKRYKRYLKAAEGLSHMTFVGRCGQYTYYDMHQVIANSLLIAQRFIDAAK